MSMNSNNNINNLNRGRIEYIDAMRGFTMILVVLQHVGTFCWKINGVSIHPYLSQIRMPMFFFISGFVLFKANVIWDSKQMISFFRKKIPVQLLSPFLFFSLFVFISKESLFNTILLDASKMGYWFTFVLFIYYIIYASIRFCIRNKWSDIILILIGCLLYPIIMPTIYNSLPLSDEIKGFLCIPNWHYFLFFVLGTLTKKHFTIFERLLDKTHLIAVCIILYFLINGYADLLPIDKHIVAHAMAFPGLIILFYFFRNKQLYFSKGTFIGRSLQYIGRRTLDIYLIHFFLLPKGLNFITLFNDYPMPIIEATASLIIALIIVAACLLLGNIIRLSPLLAHWLFGAKV